MSEGIKPSDDPPEGIRISYIIEDELEKLNVNIEKIANRLKIDYSNNYNLMKNDYFSKKIDNLKINNKILELKFKESEIRTIFKELRDSIEKMEIFVNKIISSTKLSIIMHKIPLSNLKDNDENNIENIKLKFSLEFQIFINKKQEKKFMDLTNFQKLLLIIAFKCYFNERLNLNSYFFDGDFDAKLTNKANLVKTIKILSSFSSKSESLLKNNIIFFLNKKKFENNEIEDIKIYSDKSE